MRLDALAHHKLFNIFLVLVIIVLVIALGVLFFLYPSLLLNPVAMYLQGHVADF